MKRWSGKHMRTTRRPGDRGGGQALRIFALPCSRDVSTIWEPSTGYVFSLIYFLTTHFKGWFCSGLVKAYVKYFSCTSLGPGVELKFMWQRWRELFYFLYIIGSSLFIFRVCMECWIIEKVLKFGQQFFKAWIKSGKYRSSLERW